MCTLRNPSEGRLLLCRDFLLTHVYATVLLVCPVLHTWSEQLHTIGTQGVAIIFKKKLRDVEGLCENVLEEGRGEN